MKQQLYHLLQNQGDLTWEHIMANIIVAVVLGIFIFLSYHISHRNTIYSRKFNVTLIVLTVLTAMVMTVIGNNIALSLGMVGALSIVRFRTAIKDSRDTTYIFWCIMVGICCGVGDYLVATAGSVAVFLILLIFGRIQNDTRMLLIIRGSRHDESRIEAVVYQYFSGKANLRVKNSGKDSIEFIYEVSRKAIESNKKQGKSITDALYEIGNMEYVNLVAQNDEVSS